MIVLKKLEVEEEIVVGALHSLGVLEISRELAPIQPVNIDPRSAVRSTPKGEQSRTNRL